MAKTLTVIDPNTGCILWLGTIRYGYGVYGKQHRYAHLLAYEKVYGIIPAGLTIDHICEHRYCVNVKHLELVTLSENTLRMHNRSSKRGYQSRLDPCTCHSRYSERSRKRWFDANPHLDRNIDACIMHKVIPAIIRGLIRLT